MEVELLRLPSHRVARGFVRSESTSSNLVQDHVIICPGNPGIAAFYLPFAEQLHARLGGAVSVRVVSLPGFSAEDHTATTNGKVGSVVERPVAYTLQEQCDFLHEYLRSLHLQLQCADELSRGVSPPSPKEVGVDVSQLLSPHIRPAASSMPRRQHRFILVCHSIGSYIGLAALDRAERAARATAPFGDGLVSPRQPTCLNLLVPYFQGKMTTDTSLPPVEITHACLLFPFIRMDLSHVSYWSLRFLLAVRPLVRIFVRLLALLPLSVWRLALRMVARITAEHAVRGVYDTYTNAHTANAALVLAVAEFEDVRSPAPKGTTAAVAKKINAFDPAILSAHREKLTLYYAGAESDLWAPLHQMRDFLRDVPGLDARIEPTAVHAWCAYEDQTRTMVRRVAQNIEQLQVKRLIAAGTAATLQATPLQTTGDSDATTTHTIASKL